MLLLFGAHLLCTAAFSPLPPAQMGALPSRFAPSAFRSTANAMDSSQRLRMHDRSAMTTDEKEKKLAKTHSSTIALVPPDEAWETVQALRYTLEDKGVYRWPPHVNLLYPFVVESHIPLALPKVRAALSNMEPFQVRLAEFGLFAHRRKSTLWLRPDTSPDTLALDRLQQALQDAVPECHEQRSNFGGRFSPHMTVTHLDNDKRSVRECEQLRDDLQASWQPVTFMCTEVHVMTRQGPKGQFRIRAKIFLGQTQEAGEALQDQAYAGMPSEAPPWCLGQINGGRAGDRGGRSKGKSRSRSSADDGKLLQKLQEADTVAEMAVLMTPVLGESRVSDLSAWLSSGAYLVDEQGFILEDMHDRDVRTQVHMLIKQMLSPLVSDTVKIDQMEESKVILRIRAPSFAKDARR